MNRAKIVTLSAMLGLATAGAMFIRSSGRPTAQAANIDLAQVDSGGSDIFENRGGDDAADARLIAQSNRGEALAWLTDASSARGVARWDKDEVISVIKGFYAAGAPRVYVVDIDKVAQTEVASQFVVELPSDPQARRKVFDCEAFFQAQYDEDPTPDSGQKYLHLTTD